MAGAEEVVAGARRGDTELAGLVLNERGYERFAAAGLDRLTVTLAATDAFNRRNGNVSLEQAIAAAGTILARNAAEARMPATVSLSCAFGCPFEGHVDPGTVVDLCEALAADEYVLADTIGVATPRPVRRLVERLAILGRPVGFHGHNTRNTGYAAAWAAIEGGAELLDASVGGLGGCPFSPAATGNVATEDLVWQLERDGVATGVDLVALVATARWLEATLGRRLEGYVYRAAPFP
jgi:hydroxymethylglutaryl-CoA lyase/(R)-citramalyl-CoA lyase